MGQNPYPVEIAAAGGGPVKTAGDLTFTDPGNQPGGGSQPGIAIVRAFPFAFNTAGILTGAALYVPTIGDILFRAWVEIATAWDGTTPKCDVGTFTSGTTRGWFNGIFGNGAIDLTLEDNTTTSVADYGLVTANGANDSAVTDLELSSDSANIAGPLPRIISKFGAVAPVKVCVSTTGATNGSDPGASQGAAVLYLVTATPT